MKITINSMTFLAQGYIAEEDKKFFEEELKEAISGQLNFCGVCGKFIPQIELTQALFGVSKKYVISGKEDVEDNECGLCCREHYEEEEIK